MGSTERINAFLAGITQVAEKISLSLPVLPASLIGVDCLDPSSILVAA